MGGQCWLLWLSEAVQYGRVADGRRVEVAALAGAARLGAPPLYPAFGRAACLLSSMRVRGSAPTPPGLFGGHDASKTYRVG
jgi:hypothetical protein